MADVDRVVREGKTVGWQARWRDPDGRQRKQTFRVKAEAQRHLAAMLADAARGTYLDPAAGRVTVTDYARHWAATRPHRASSATTVESRIKHHIEATRLSGMRIASVRPTDVQAWVTDRSAVLAPSTLKVVVDLLRAVMAAAVLDRVIAVSPATRLTLPRYEPPKVVPLTVAEVRAAAAAMPPRTRALVLVAAGLGLRIGELLGLRVEDVDFLRRTVHIRVQLLLNTKNRGPLKTPRSERDIPLPTMVSEVIAAHLAEYPSGKDGSVFTAQHGGPFGHTYVENTFKAAVNATGLPASTTPHDLRHHFASVLLAAGESVVTVAERLGDTPAMVLEVYGHVMPGSEDRTRKAIDAAWSSAPNVPREAVNQS